VFRQWYVGELVAQLRAAAAGEPLPEPQPFESRLLAELDRVAIAQRASDRAARLYAVTVALATATTPEAVAAAVLNEGVAALGASGGGMLLATGNDTLALPGTVGYDERVVARLRNESRDAELPAAVALRTGRTVWIETREDRDREFPALVGLEASTVAMCAVPLVVDGRRLGALRFSFVERRLFDDDERRFVLALAAQTAQALDRAQLHHARLDVSRRLQRSLLPPTLPDIPGLDVAALYHPFGDGIDVGGDFYDVWTAGPDRWAIAIGDAAGTGPEAAVMTAFVRHTLRVLTMSAWDPEDVLRTLNTALLASVPEADAERFCTALLGIVTPYGDGVAVRLAGGGHPPALVRRTGGTVETAWVGGSLLGLFASADVDAIRVVLHPGDTLVLVTDGVLEARREGDMFDAAGLEHAVSSSDPGAAATVAAIQDAVLRHTGGVLTDDMAAVVVHVPMR
jgi:serine phosphatase RsbU (regulator of sigma subunit)